MSTTLVHIYHEDEDTGNIRIQVSLPIDNPKYCIEIMNIMNEIKSDTLKKLSLDNQNNMKRDQGVFHKILQLMGKRVSKTEKKKLTDELAKMNQAEKTGKGIQLTLNNLATALNGASEDDRDRMINDINASIKNIVGGA